MTINYAKVAKPNTQDSPLPNKQMVKNSDGLYVFGVDKFKKLDRFLILGSEGGSYYASQQNLTKECMQSVMDCLTEDGVRTVNRIVEISVAGRAPKPEPAIFALALATKGFDAATTKAALSAIPKVCRTATHLFTFIDYRKQFGGWNRSLRNAVSAWYNDKSQEDLAYQMLKYRQRNGWAHKDVLRLAHPSPPTAQHGLLYQWAVGKGEANDVVLVHAFNEIQALKSESAKDVKKACELIKQHRMSREFLPTELLTNNKVWEALLEDMPMTAMVRNLGVMTKNGLLCAGSDATRTVLSHFRNVEKLKKSRIHPLTLLNALTTYSSGHGLKSDGVWTPVQSIVDALDEAFYASFGNVEPTNKRMCIALDVSGSMTWGTIAGSSLTPAVASAALALVTSRVEKDCSIFGFGGTLEEIRISSRMRLDDVVKAMNSIRMGSTNCSLPMLHAKENHLKFDAFSTAVPLILACACRIIASQAGLRMRS